MEVWVDGWKNRSTCEGACLSLLLQLDMAPAPKWLGLHWSGHTHNLKLYRVLQQSPYNSNNPLHPGVEISTDLYLLHRGNWPCQTWFYSSSIQALY